MANFDATKGGSSANSYATVEEADDYYEFEYGADEWPNIDDITKEKLLASATRMIDALRVKYDKADTDQALKFPVQGTIDGCDEAKAACIIQALHLHRNAAVINEARTNAIHGIKSETLGKTSKTMAGYNSLATYATEALIELRPYIDLTIKAQRG